MTRLRHTLAAALLALQVVAAMAAPESDAAERARIAADRQAVEAHFQAALRECQARFVVSQCVVQAKQDRRLALEPLQRQAHLLDDARRRQRAVDRLRVIQERESAAAARPALAASAPPRSAPPAARAPVQHRVRQPASAASAAQQAQHRAAQQQQRVQEAEAHQAAVQARNARRDAQHKPASGLPLPPPAPASGP